jgi:hypothetical protein
MFYFIEDCDDLWIIEDMNITNYCLILSLGFVLVKFMISGG